MRSYRIRIESAEIGGVTWLKPEGPVDVVVSPAARAAVAEIDALLLPMIQAHFLGEWGAVAKDVANRNDIATRYHFVQCASSSVESLFVLKNDSHILVCTDIQRRRTILLLDGERPWLKR